MPQAACEMRCPDFVLCPYDTITKEGLTRGACDRVKACASASCPGEPSAICQVDPCDCRATWLNAETGQPADCDRVPVSQEPVDLKQMINSIATECESLRKKNGVLGHVYVPDCDSDGVFLPTQCITLASKKECWCVDASGHQIGEPFAANSKTCGEFSVDLSMNNDNINKKNTNKIIMYVDLLQSR